MCPAVMGKIRCPHRPESMKLDRGRPEVLTPPEHPPACCARQTITVPPEVAAKTRQKHDYPSPEHRRSYARRTSAERAFSTIKDPATTSIARGWCRLMGVTPLALWLACLLAVRNQRILSAWDARQQQNARRAAAGLPPKTRKRRRQTLASLAAGRHNRRGLPRHTSGSACRHTPGTTTPVPRALTQASQSTQGPHRVTHKIISRPASTRTPRSQKMSDPNVNMDTGQT